jgi:toxin ParE1/3/4
LRRLFLSRSARTDLAEIAEYISGAAGLLIATEVIVRIRERCLLLAETAGEIGVERPELGDGVRSFPVPPHILFFRYREDEVEIVRVLHERRDIESALTD